MKRKRLPWIVILLCLIATAAIPTLRQMPTVVIPFFLGILKEPSLWHIPEPRGQEYPRDLYLQLLFAESYFRKTPQQTSDDITQAVARFDPICRLDPQSPAPHLRLGLWLLQDGGGLNRVEAVSEYIISKGFKPEARSPLAQLCLNQAIEQFRQAAALDPKNAAPDYFLAYCYFANKQDALADAALRSALSKPEWTIYARETRQAALKYYEAGYAALPAVNMVRGAEPTYFLHVDSRLRAFARLLTGLGKENLQKGNTSQAAFYFASEVHFGEVCLRNADSMIDGFVALAILQITSGPFLSREEREQIYQLDLTRQEKCRRMGRLSKQRLEDFLTANNNKAAAENYAQTMSYGKNFLKDSRSVIARYTRTAEKTYTSPWLAQAILCWGQAGLSLLLLLAVLLLSLIARVWREKSSRPTWRWWEGAIIFLLALLPAHIYALFLGPHNPEEIDMFEVFNPALLAVKITLPLLLLLPLIGALLKRRRQPPEARLGKIRAILASWRILLPPMAALLLLLSIIFTVPAQIVLGKWITSEREIIRQGEVNYWKIGRPRG